MLYAVVTDVLSDFDEDASVDLAEMEKVVGGAKVAVGLLLLV